MMQCMRLLEAEKKSIRIGGGGHLGLTRWVHGDQQGSGQEASGAEGLAQALGKI